MVREVIVPTPADAYLISEVLNVLSRYSSLFNIRCTEGETNKTKENNIIFIINDNKFKHKHICTIMLEDDISLELLKKNILAIITSLFDILDIIYDYKKDK